MVHSAPHPENCIFQVLFLFHSFQVHLTPRGVIERLCSWVYVTSVISILVGEMDEMVAYQAFMSETKDVLNKCNPGLCNLPALMETQLMLQPGILSLHENIEIKELIFFSVASLFWLH